MAWSAIISAWLVGLLGGVHCLAMCGGFVAAASMRDADGKKAATGVPLLPARALLRRQLEYHLGRISAYTLLGALFGTAGAVALRAADLLPLQRALYVVANGFLLLLALNLVTRSVTLAGLERAGARAFGAALPLLQPMLRSPRLTGRVALGILWGFVPCALVYSMLPLALFAGGALEGGLVMLAFGLGTLPNLIATNLLVARTRPLHWKGAGRVTAAFLLAAFGALGIYRALYDPAALAQGPFCLIP
jgi:sulfite exporter TauE/SafE